MKIKQLILGLIICGLCMTMTQLVNHPTVQAADEKHTEDSYAFRWFYKFKGIKDENTNSTSGTLEVMEVVELWYENKKVASSETKLSCVKDGEIDFDGEIGAIVFTGRGYIKCETLELQEEILRLSSTIGDPLDICGGASSCPIFIDEVINLISIVPPDNIHPMLDGPIFVAPQVVLSGNGTTAKNEHVVTLKLHHSPLMEALISDDFVTDQFELEISQSGHEHDFYVNKKFVTLAEATDVLTEFTSEPETIYFGFNPNTDKFLTGSYYNGEFDPFTFCLSCYE